MREITQQQIISIAPNASAVNNARKISNSSGFVSRSRSADDTFYMGECKGSGKSNYIVSADFIEEDKPVFRCTCPSRQFPCKHSLALLFEMEAQKEFSVCEIPENILEKRSKKEAKEQKKAEEATQPPKEKKTNKAARTKKIKRQLEGLEMLEKMVGDLLNSGLGTMGGVSLKTYRDLAKQLGDYYLPGPLNLMNELILEIEKYQKDADTIHYENAVEILVRLRSLTKKAGIYLQDKLDSGNMEDDDNILYEALGGIWTLERLKQLGLKKENVNLVQLSFETYYDEARKEWIDLGYFVDVESGEVHVSCNYRPVKALKYIKEEDSMFDMVKVPLLTYYPGDMNKRIRWDKSTLIPLHDEIRRTIMQKAHTDLAGVIKTVKNQIKNTLSEDFAAVMIHFKKIGKIKGQEETFCYVLEDTMGNRIVLRDKKGHEGTVKCMASLKAGSLFEDQVLFGIIYYDSSDHQICMQPYSIVTEKAIVRLLY